MLSKERRVNTKLFKQVLKEGRSYNARELYIKTLNNPGKTKLTFVVPRSIEKKAVSRNKLKRIGLAYIEDIIEKTKDGFSGVIFLKNSDKFPNKQDIEKLLEAVGIIEKRRQEE